ncbi:ubiquitin-conjugating enzyme/RWD-like protein [Gymnopilus junonius]|uniref:Ubiquitin-conjugating enzyme/RWD-like protein n=1 Tax=Gymnopilus junonius TaxID=109634 RepID=A0A9P5TVP2_GYMJU|nr:ubiquitin-conjugating enzyme/RWD-like protein [Gymnopilus junonius]
MDKRQDSNTRPPTRQPQHDSQSQAHDSILARTAVSLEYASLRNSGHCPLGIYIVPTSTNILVWDAVFFVHQGYYADSILKFRLTFPKNYPESAPAVDFITDVFHPLISQRGSFNLSPRFRPWRAREHHVFDVLHWIKVAFKKHALDHFQESECSNKEAYRFVYHESTQSFAALARQSASLSRSESALFELDHPSPISNVGTEIAFRKMNADQLAKERSKLGLAAWQDERSP